MYLENGRDIVRGVLILAFAAVAYWGNLALGLALLVLMGVMILQSAFTGWCPADLILRPAGLKRRLESKSQM
jgi:Inner membrane protein YgaP-like, transmembrane domain